MNRGLSRDYLRFPSKENLIRLRLGTEIDMKLICRDDP